MPAPLPAAGADADDEARRRQQVLALVSRFQGDFETKLLVRQVPRPDRANRRTQIANRIGAIAAWAHTRGEDGHLELSCFYAEVSARIDKLARRTPDQRFEVFHSAYNRRAAEKGWQSR